MYFGDDLNENDNFNSHAHEGRDTFNISFFTEIEISTHTPTRGVTPTYPTFKLSIIISTHTPTRGVTHTAFITFQAVSISTHTPTRGVTLPIIYLQKE